MSRSSRIVLMVLFADVLCWPAVAHRTGLADEKATALGRIAREHWAFAPPRRSPPPSVRQLDWSRGPIDAFVLRTLESKSLVPSPVASRTALAKRLALTVTGLPPTLDDVDAFLADQGADSVERFVDRLLASPRYGERMAVPWLDLARYADTHGYHADAHRDMWRWRDWVIQAFNRGLPFDQFTIEQLAGDLLPDATRDQRIATGFNRNHMIIFENGVVDEEYRTEYVADRVATTATVWLAQTMQCARCHDHKHDPFTQRDYYRLFAFFNNVPERGVDGDQGNAVPFLAAPTSRQQVELAQLERTMAGLREEIRRRLDSPAPGQSDWEQRLRTGAVATAAPPDDEFLRLAFDERDGQETRNLARDGQACEIRGPAVRVAGKTGAALLFGGDTAIECGELGRFAAQDAFSASAWVFPTSDSPAMFVARQQEDESRRGYSVGLVGRRLTLRLTHDVADRVLEVRGDSPLTARKWQHVTVVYDGTGKASGVRMWVDGQPTETVAERDTLRGPIQSSAPLVVGGVAPEPYRGLLDELRLFARALTPTEAVALAGLNPFAELLAIPPERRTDEQTRMLRREFLATQDTAFRDSERRLRDLTAAYDQLNRSLPTVMVMQELPEPRPTHILARGRFDMPGERVEPGVPDWLSVGGQPTRLGLARWIVSPDNPLTARVAVNRYWHEIFGQGIVRSLDDFGTHGDRPSHPELLDWLAVEFASPDRFAWDIKRLIRELVASSTFRQANRTIGGSPVDAENRLLSRGPRHRLSAEMIRDGALAVSGRFDQRLGGPSVFPYQPAGLWEELAFDTQSYTAQRYVPSVGGDLYRRSLYTFWKRASPPATLSILDAPDREVCTAMRVTTTTPQQALVLLNDPTFVEAARGLADRVLGDETLRSDDQRVARMFRLVTARSPGHDERNELGRLLADMRRSFDDDPQSARAFLAAGDSGRADDPSHLAALAVVAQVILSLDENLNLP